MIVSKEEVILPMPAKKRKVAKKVAKKVVKRVAKKAKSKKRK